jgi:hypothetical protein
VIVSDDQGRKNTESVKEISKKEQKSIISTVGVEEGAITLLDSLRCMDCSEFVGRVSSGWAICAVRCLSGR